MKRIIAIIEAILLVFILYVSVLRNFDEKLSAPFYIEPKGVRLFINIGIIIAVIFRIYQLVNLITDRKSVSLKLQLFALGIYLLMIATDLFIFIEWNIYANMYFYVTLILLSPLLLGMMTLVMSNNSKPST